ncbi:MauE/DoxX family redox-associated membrane protein [Demetria terragena]|uniref:MauE/DoxX family redox-associated membrane protein n=1 Tax=Demetria terragena TaxID=63959 RepID=UPI000375670C|nr:MauE/DoxX family redox-associated membrane protein [Demetria terragena]
MNSGVAVLAEVATATALGLSGVAQLASPAAHHAALRSLRLHRTLSTALAARLWAVAEVAVALTVLASPAPWSGIAAIAAVGMFLVFIVVLGRALRFEEPAHCACFGRFDDQPVGPATLTRAFGLLALSVIGLSGSQNGSVIQRASNLTSPDAGLLQLGLLLAGAIVVLEVMARQRHRTPIAAAPPSEPTSDVLPEAYLLDLFGARHDVRTLVHEDRAVLIFLSTTCSACLAVAHEVPTWREDLRSHGVDLRVVIADAPGAALGHFPQLGAYLHQDEGEALADHLGLDILPAAVYVGRDGKPEVSDGPAEGTHAIATLVKNALTHAQRAPHSLDVDGHR